MADVPGFAQADLSAFDWQRREPGFAGLIRMILGQQVSGAAAAAMWRKLEAALPKGVEPKPFLKLSDEALAACGFSRQKARYGRALAEALISGTLDLDRLAHEDDEAAIAELTALPGSGRWSAEVYLMFCLGRPDVWPVGDLGIALGVQYLLGLPEKPKPAEIAAAAEAWRPHRTAAALLTWHYYGGVIAAKRAEAKKPAKKPERSPPKKRSQKQPQTKDSSRGSHARHSRFRRS